MTANGRDEARKLLPRWRPWRVALDLRELAPLTTTATPAAFARSLESARLEWLKRPTLSRAGELMTAQVSSGFDAGEDTRTALEFVLASDTATTAARDLATSIMFNSTDPDSEWHGDVDQPGVGILRQRTRRHPRNTYNWLDLGRAHFAAGHNEAALRCVITSLSLSPHDRYVLRSATRFFVQIGDENTARRHLGTNLAGSGDPWLMSAALNLAGVRQPSLRIVKALLESGSLPPWHLSELGATVASLEHENGSERLARRFMRNALEDPNENVLAHAYWAPWAQPLVEERSGPPDPRTLPYEALARKAASHFDWAEAMQYAVSWQSDEPFGALSAAVGSCYAVEAGAFAVAEKMASVGLVANPDDITLLNNRAFARASQWDLEGAAEDLRLIDFKAGEPDSVGCAYATAGFIAFRDGDPITGRLLYERAISIFNRRRSTGHAARAAINLAKEERRLGAVQAIAALARAESLVRQSRSSEIENVWNRAQADLATQNQISTPPPTALPPRATEAVRRAAASPE